MARVDARCEFYLPAGRILMKPGGETMQPKTNTTAGSIRVSDGVIVSIVSRILDEIDGVYSLAPRPAAAAERLLSPAAQRPVQTTLHGGAAVVGIFRLPLLRLPDEGGFCSDSAACQGCSTGYDRNCGQPGKYLYCRRESQRSITDDRPPAWDGGRFVCLGEGRSAEYDIPS